MATTRVVADGYEVQDIIKTALLNHLRRIGVTEAVKVTDWDEDIWARDSCCGGPTWEANTTVRYELEDGSSMTKVFDGRFWSLIEDIRYQRIQITMMTED